MTENAKKSVLIVDDGQDVIDVLSYALLKEGFSVVAARNGEEALEKLRSFLPDIILLDVMMPKMDGSVFHKILQSNPLWNEIPVVVMTGSGAWGKEQLSPQDVSAYLEKPFSLSDIIQTVRNVLNTSVK